MPTLTTRRLVLRPFTVADVDAFAALNADADVARHLTADGRPLSGEDSWRQLAMFLGHWQLRGYGMWAVAERGTPHLLIGRVGVHEPDGWPGTEVGWVIARAHWGKGYATEAGAAAMRYAFEVLGMARVVSIIPRENVRSRAVAARLGEGYSGEWVHRGVTCDIHAIDRERWSTMQRAVQGDDT